MVHCTQHLLSVASEQNTTWERTAGPTRTRRARPTQPKYVAPPGQPERTYATNRADEPGREKADGALTARAALARTCLPSGLSKRARPGVGPHPFEEDSEEQRGPSNCDGIVTQNTSNSVEADAQLFMVLGGLERSKGTTVVVGQPLRPWRRHCFAKGGSPPLSGSSSCLPLDFAGQFFTMLPSVPQHGRLIPLGLCTPPIEDCCRSCCRHVGGLVEL